ncbi:MAG: DNA glycosylase AlkZ-like family protein, partial [Catenulispora sp.]
DGIWGRRGATPFVLAEPYLGRPLTERGIDALILRYLAAFGPASPRDMQAWSGMRRLRDAFEPLRPRLRTFRGESGAELFDLPDAPRPGPDAEAPVRFLPTFDNVLFGHADRTRIVTAAQRPYLVADAALIVDGMVGGLWKIKAGVLTIRLFGPLSPDQESAVQAEAAALLSFAAGNAPVHAVEFAPLDKLVSGRDDPAY